MSKEMYFCAVCTKEYPKGSRCLGEFVKEPGEPPNHIEDCRTEEDRELWTEWPDILGQNARGEDVTSFTVKRKAPRYDDFYVDSESSNNGSKR